jgi:hypothetical protein
VLRADPRKSSRKITLKLSAGFREDGTGLRGFGTTSFTGFGTGFDTTGLGSGIEGFGTGTGGVS